MPSTEIKALNEAGNTVAVKATAGGILHNLPYNVVWTAKGYGYEAMATAAVASLVVRPSTLSMATLFNNESGGGKSYVIERAFAHNLVAAAQCVSTLWLCVHPVGMTAPTNDITVRNNTGGKAAGGSLAMFDIAAAVVADGWFPWGQDSTTVTVTTPGGVLEANVAGRIVVPPQAAISIQVVSSVNTSTFCSGFHWFEVPAKELATA